MLAQADFERALGFALFEFAPAWTIVGGCAPVDRFDASHWGSGPQSFRVTLRHHATGRLKMLGQRLANEPGATVHPAVALSLVGAYRHGNSEPIRAYLEEIGVVTGNPSGAGQVLHRPVPLPPSPVVRSQPTALPSLRATGMETAELRASALAVAVPAPPATALLASHAPARREVARPSATRPRQSAPLPRAPEARTPMLGRLRRELQIWYWRRGVRPLE
jgi:hypothetical protein